MNQSLLPSSSPLAGMFVLPQQGAVITSEVTGNTYVIDECIGEGGFGIVFKCNDVWNNRLVAKILKPRDGLTQNLEQEAVDELNKLLHVRHPNITHVFDAFAFKVLAT